VVSAKRVFMGLCLAVWFVNVFMIGHSTVTAASFWGSFVMSLVSVPVWGLIGAFLSGIGLFLFRLLQVDVCTGLSLWHKADIGLALAIVVKPALGIPF
jgi:hypothetical protein